MEKVFESQNFFWGPTSVLQQQERKPDEFLIKFQKSWNAFAKYGKRERIPPLHSHMNAKRIHNLLHKSLTLWKYVHKTAYFSQSLWQPQAGILPAFLKVGLWKPNSIHQSLKNAHSKYSHVEALFKNFLIKLEILFTRSTIHSEKEVEKLSTTACLLLFVPLQLYAQWDINRL